MNKIFFNRNWWFIGIVLSFLLFFALSLPGDPDLGWHLGSGRYLWAHLFPPHTDIFSWSMPNFPWIAHEWMTDRIMYVLYHIGGLWPLVILFSLIIVLAFWLPTRMQQFRKTPLSAIVGSVIALLVCWNIIGVRPQMLTLVGTAITMLILFAWRENQRIKLLYWLPILFFVWVNFHGGFLSGFVVIGMFIVGEALRRILAGPRPAKNLHLLSWQELFRLGFIGIGGGLLATLINPYGWHIYREIYDTLSQSDILNRIAEWLPVTLQSSGSYNAVILGVLIIVLIFINRFNFDLTKLVLAVTFFFFGVTSWRHLPLFALVSLPLLIEQLGPVVEHGLRDLARRTWLLLILVILVFGWGLNRVDVLRTALASSISYGQATGYPTQATDYIKQHFSPDVRLVTEYGWGGYIIWQLPEYKLFIDGRMAIWRQNGLRIFDDYTKLLSLNPKDITEMVDKWHPEIILLPREHLVNNVLGNNPMGWKLIYSDEFSLLWQYQPKNNASIS